MMMKTIAVVLLLSLVLAECVSVAEAAAKKSTRSPWKRNKRRRIGKRKMSNKRFKTNEPSAARTGFKPSDNAACKRSAFINTIQASGKFSYVSCTVSRRKYICTGICNNDPNQIIQAECSAIPNKRKRGSKNNARGRWTFHKDLTLAEDQCPP